MNTRVAVSVYDAITTTRPYRRARSKQFAFGELRADAAKGRSSSQLVETFIALIERTPPAVAVDPHP